MKKEDLENTHDLYDKNVKRWKFFYASYEGSRSLIDIGALPRHERESMDNYNRRINNAYGFSYSTSVIDLLNFYLFKKPTKFNLGDLSKDESWENFIKDCDLYKNNFDEYVIEEQKNASIYGHVGVLVDRPEGSFETKEEELKSNVYPYLSSYSPLSILDWKEERDKYSRPYLSYLKLKDKDGSYRLWWIDRWEIWVVDKNNKAQLLNSGTHTLGEIPFVWFVNVKSNNPYLGISDLKDISYIDVSIMRNLSQGEEIIDYAAFPMLRKPKNEGGSTDGDDVGVTAILEFDPDNPESKSDWLEAECKSPIEALLMWIERKVNEIYRSANTGGISATEKSTGVKSGVALRTEFELLNSKLVKKGLNVAKAKLSIIRLWLKWQRNPTLFNDVNFNQINSYDVERLSEDLENALSAKTLVMSKKFQSALQKSLVRLVLPTLTDSEFFEIDEEIDNYKMLDEIE